MKAAFDRRRRTIVSMLNEIDGVVCPTPEGAFYAYPSVKGLLGREHRRRAPIDTSAELAEYILDEAEVAVVPGEAFGSPGLPAAVLRARATTTWSRASPGCRSSSLEPSPRGRPGRSRTPAEGAPAPALHRLDAARDAARARRARRHPAARLARRASGRRGCRRPTRRAGSASSGSTTWRGRCCAPRTTYAGWCARPPRTTSRDGGRWLEIQVDPCGLRRPVRRDHRLHRPGARRRPRGLRGHRPRHRGRDRRQPHPAPARRPHAGPARRAVRRPRRGRLRAVQRRAARDAPRTSRRPSRSPSGPGCCSRRTAASCSARTASAPASTTLHADRLGHGVRVGGGPRAARPGRRRRASPLEVCPVSNVALGVYSDLTSVPLPHAARRPAPPSRWAPTTRCCSGPGWPASTPRCAPPTT